MYMDGTMTTGPQRGNVPDHTPTSGEWERLMSYFPEPHFRRVIERLKSDDNMSVEVCRDPDFAKSNIDPMNARLEEKDSVFRLVSTYARRYGPDAWDEIRFERLRFDQASPQAPCA
jgi:hypothetical protein